MKRLITAVCGLALLAPAAASAADAPPGSATLVPNAAGRPSALEIDLGAEVLAREGTNETPQAISLLGTRGLKIDRRAVAERCDDAQAERFDCPAASRIGTGSAKGYAEGALVPGGRYDFTASIAVYLAPPRQAGDTAGVVVQVSEPGSGQRFSAKGRIFRNADFGWETRFDELAGGGQLPPGVTIRLERVQLRIQADRTVRKRVTVRRGGERRRVIRRVRYSFLTNPRTCPGAWPYRLRAEYAGRSDEYNGTFACRAG